MVTNSVANSLAPRRILTLLLFLSFLLTYPHVQHQTKIFLVQPISSSQNSINAPTFKKLFLLPRTVPSYPTSSIIIGYLSRLTPATATNRSSSKILFYHQRTNTNGKKIQPSCNVPHHSNKYEQSNPIFTTLSMSYINSPAKLSQQSSELLTDITDRSNKKRPSSNENNRSTNNKTQLISTSTQHMQVDEQQVETLSNSNASTGSIPLDTDPTVTSTEITWGKINQLLQPLRQHEPGFPPLTNIQQLFTAPLPDDLVADIQTLRERSHMPHTMSRILYDRWTSAKSPEACLTTHQLDTVLHFLDVFATELSMEIIERSRKDQTMFAQYLHSVMTYPEVQPLETELETCYARHETEEQSVLSRQLTLFLDNISCSTRTVSSRIVPLSVAYIHLADLILIDSPLLEAADDVWIPIGEEDIPSCTTVSSRSQAPVSNDRPLPKKLPSVQDILEDNSFKEFTDTTRGMKLTALNTVNYGCTDGSADGHSPHRDILAGWPTLLHSTHAFVSFDGSVKRTQHLSPHSHTTTIYLPTLPGSDRLVTSSNNTYSYILRHSVQMDTNSTQDSKLNIKYRLMRSVTSVQPLQDFAQDSNTTSIYSPWLLLPDTTSSIDTLFYILRHSVKTDAIWDACCSEGWPTLHVLSLLDRCASFLAFCYMNVHAFSSAGAMDATRPDSAISALYFFIQSCTTCTSLVFRHALLLFFITTTLDYEKRIVNS